MSGSGSGSINDRIVTFTEVKLGEGNWSIQPGPQGFLRYSFNLYPEQEYSSMTITRSDGKAKQNWLKDHAYSTYGTGPNRPSTQLVYDEKIVDITSFYSARDQLCHVVYVTSDRYLHEITYSSQE